MITFSVLFSSSHDWNSNPLPAWRRPSVDRSYPKSQFGPLRVTPRERHFTIDQNQRQRILAGALQERFYGSVPRRLVAAPD